MQDKTFYNKEITIEKITLSQIDRIGQMRNLGSSNKHHFLEEIDSLVLIYLPMKIAEQAMVYKKDKNVTRSSTLETIDEYYIFIKALMEKNNIAWGTRRILVGSLE